MVSLRLGDVVDGQRLTDDVLDREAGVECCHRVLEDDLHVLAHAQPVRPRELADVPPGQGDGAGLRAGHLQDLEDRRRLPAARLAHQSEDLTAADLEVDAVHRLHGADLLLEDRPRGEREVTDQTLDAQDRLPVLPVGRGHLDRLGTGEHLGGGQLAGLDLGSADAGRRVTAAELDQRRLGRRAGRYGDRAARLERTAGRQVGQRGRPPLERDQPRPARGDQVGHGPQQPDGVGHLRTAEHVVDGPGLDEASGVHHADAVGVAGDDAQVVGDQHHGGPGDLLGPLQHVEDLRLDGHVEGGRRLVGDDQARVVGDRDGDHHPLAHPAGELVREGVDPTLRCRDPDHAKQLDRTHRRGLPAERPVVQHQALGDLVADRVDGGERRERILEDHRDLLAPESGQLPVVHREQRLAAQQHLAGDHGAAREQAHDGHRGDRLAGARLTDDPEELALLHRVADPAHGAHRAGGLREAHGEVAHLEQRGLSHWCSPTSGRPRRAARRRPG